VLNYFTNDLVGVHGIFNISYITQLITNRSGTRVSLFLLFHFSRLGIFKFEDLAQFGINASNFSVTLPLPFNVNAYAPLFWDLPSNAKYLVGANTSLNVSIVVTDFSINGLESCNAFDLFTNSLERQYD
jgi:hypothetical protein